MARGMGGIGGMGIWVRMYYVRGFPGGDAYSGAMESIDVERRRCCHEMGMWTLEEGE